MAQVKFKSLEDFLDYLPEREKVVTRFLRDIVLDALPNCTEKLSYSVPYFYLNKPVCFIWPGSILWGKQRRYEGVRMGFVQGHLIESELDYFKLEHRKFVSFRDFQSTSDVDIDMLKTYLFEASDIDSRLSNTKP